jgi:hypothetical protein
MAAMDGNAESWSLPHCGKKTKGYRENSGIQAKL